MSREMKYLSPSEAVGLINSGDSIYIQGSTSIPEVLCQALADRGNELKDVTVYAAFAVGRCEAPFCRPEYKDAFNIKSLFVANNIRRWLADGYGTTIPAFLGEIPALFRDGTLPLDAVFLNVSPPDENGYCSFGVSADLAVSAVECARKIIVQVNKAMPYSYGDALIHVSRIDAAVEVDDPLVEVPTAVPTEIDSAIGRHIAELIPDGATLQIGVGGIPNAVLSALKDHQHLGLHTEAMTDGVLPLLESGVIDNSCKRVCPGISVASLALGSKRLYEYMDYRKNLLLKDVAWTNAPFRIAQNPKVMAINSAVEVDLTGQVCADSVGTRIISGVGGQHDFMYGGSLSEGGKTFIAIPSMTEKGRSKINPVLAEGAGVVTTRHMVQHVVTEYGVASLRGKSLAERARALVSIAHPSVREELERAAYDRLGWSFLRVR
jgi:acyl-CoA hydrolase